MLGLHRATRAPVPPELDWLPSMRLPKPLAAAACALLLLGPAPRAAASCDTSGLADGTQVVELTLSNGSLCLEMLTADAPINVANFLYYVTSGAYDGSLFHRHVYDFVLQGGDQRRDGAGGFEKIPKRNDDPVMNEACTADTPAPNVPLEMICSVRGNERGTVAAAKLAGAPNSASTNFFINTRDNRVNLDYTNDGFTVYARVMGSGMDYVDSLVPTSAYRRQSITGQLGGFAGVSLMQTPSEGDYAGCYDPSGNGGAVVVPQSSPLAGKADPRDRSELFVLSTLCSAVPVADPAGFVPNGCSGTITSSDELSVGYDPLAEVLDPPTATFFSHSCAAVDEFLAAIDTASQNTSYQAAFASQVVYIESATLTVLPEPARVAMTIASLLCVGALRRQRRRV